MEGCRVDGRNAPLINSPEEMAGRFQAEVMALLPEWKRRFSHNPGELQELEREVHAAYSRGADLLVAGLISLLTRNSQFDQTCERARQEFAYSLEKGRSRQVAVRLLGGLMMWITTLYCAARKSAARGGEKRPGVHVELAQMGFGKGCTPELQSRVARQAALCPSLESARQELERDGVLLDLKSVRRIAAQCGEGLLCLRAQELKLWRAGQLPAGTELAGQQVCVQIDGGRMRIRGELRDVAPSPEKMNADGLPCEQAPGRSRKRPRKTFAADWREPKLLTIFVHDEEGRMQRHSQATLDGTLLGPDALAELVAMHLHRLGAARAKSVTFVCDGGTWIWARIPSIVRLAKLEAVTVHEVLDCYHAVHHVSLALAALGMGEKQRLPVYRTYRTLLRNGQWRQVVDDLREVACGEPEGSQVWTEIAYLEKHGEAGRLKYPTFRGLGLPIGSGAIESNIRRIINLRLKGNSIYWREARGEAMLQLRAYILTDRWDERLAQLRVLRCHDARKDWTWNPQPMSPDVERATQSSA